MWPDTIERKVDSVDGGSSATPVVQLDDSGDDSEDDGCEGGGLDQDVTVRSAWAAAMLEPPPLSTASIGTLDRDDDDDDVVDDDDDPAWFHTRGRGVLSPPAPKHRSHMHHSTHSLRT